MLMLDGGAGVGRGTMVTSLKAGERPLSWGGDYRVRPLSHGASIEGRRTHPSISGGHG